MTPRRLLLAALGCFVLTPFAPAGPDPTDATSLEKQYRLELPIRKAISTDPKTDTRTFSVDALFDKKAGRLFYAAQETPALVVLPADEKTLGKNNKPAKALYRFVLKVREWDEKDFSDKTRQIAIAVFRDENTGNQGYVGETGAVAVVAAPRKSADKKEPNTRWLYRLRMKVRHAGWDENPIRCNVEVYRETNSGRLIYLADNGNLAVSAAGKDFDGKEAKEVDWSHAVELAARKPGADKFDRNTPKFGIEVYHDLNSQTTLYITETRALAVLPGIKTLDKSKEPEWRQRLTYGKWSAEEYLNPNLNHLMFITSDGALAVLPAK